MTGYWYTASCTSVEIDYGGNKDLRNVSFFFQNAWRKIVEDMLPS
jgi:hypothetical protein